MKGPGIHELLPLDQPVAVELTPHESGEVRFAARWT